jgi:hypothetical protein
MRLSRGSSAAASSVGTDSRPRLRPIQLESWRLLWQEYVADQGAQSERRQSDAQRRRVRPEVAALLRRFLSGEIDVAGLRSTFDRRTKTDWSGFGLQGSSGAMFLNTLVKHAPDPTAVDAVLRDSLPLPDDEREARVRLAIFAAFLSEVRDANAGGAGHVLHESHAAFFVSMWWHLQAPDRWPLFHPSARHALQVEEEIYTPLPDVVEDYLAFRKGFLTLTRALAVTPWALEYLCRWHQQREPRAEDSPYTRVVRRSPRPRVYSEVPSSDQPRMVIREAAPLASPDTPADVADRATAAGRHTEVQWLVATLGRQLGCRVWVAANDHAREWHNERLGDLSIDRLPPLGLHPDAERLVSLIDVVWLQGANQVVAAFEVERTTSVHSGLLRMADLTALSPNLSFPLFVVTPRARMERVRRELSRPTFQQIALHRRCGFFAEEDLIEAAPGIARWAGAPAAIRRLAEWVGDVERSP